MPLTLPNTAKTGKKDYNCAVATLDSYMQGLCVAREDCTYVCNVAYYTYEG